MSDRQADLGSFSVSAPIVDSMVEKVENVSTNGGLSGGVVVPPTPSEAKMLALLRKGQTVADAAISLSIRRSQAYKLRKALIEKGHWSSSGLHGGQNVTSPAVHHVAPPTADARYRLHGLLLTVPVRNAGERYLRKMARENVSRVNGCRVTLSPRFVKIRGHKELCFWGVSPEDALTQVEEWCENYLIALESKLGTLLVKPGTGFELFYHLAETKNGLAEDSRVQRQKIVVRGENGKVWLITDNSFNLDEMETVESRSAGEDMERVVAPYFNSIREHAHLLRTPPESWAMQDRQAVNNLEMGEMLRAMLQVQQQMQSQIGALMQAELGRSKSLNDEMEKRLSSLGAPGAADYSQLRGWM